MSRPDEPSGTRFDKAAMSRTSGTAGRIGAFVRRDARQAFSYRLQFWLDALSLGFTAVTYSLLAKIVAPGEVAGGYLAFVAVGIAVSTFLNTTVVLGASTLRQEQIQGTFETTLSAGVRPWQMAAGISAYPLLSGIVRAIAFSALAMLAGARVPDANWLLAATAFALGAIAFAGLGLAGSALVVVAHQGTAATTWIIALSTLIGGAVFPPRLLPGWVRAMAELSPFTHMLRLARAALLEGASFGQSGGRLGALALVAVAFAAAGAGAMTLAFRIGRRTGALVRY